MGLTLLIMRAVIDPVMRAVITQMQGFSAVKMQASSAFWHYNVVGCQLRTLPDAGFKLCVLVLQWHWDAGFKLCVLAIETRASSSASWPLHEWLWLALRLKYRLYFLMTYPQWFLDSLQNPLQSFQNSAVDWDGFQNTLDFSSSSNALKTGLAILWDFLRLILSGFWSSWVYC